LILLEYDGGYRKVSVEGVYSCSKILGHITHVGPGFAFSEKLDQRQVAESEESGQGNAVPLNVCSSFANGRGGGLSAGNVQGASYPVKLITLGAQRNINDIIINDTSGRAGRCTG
jgi:hypothetical protein